MTRCSKIMLAAAALSLSWLAPAEAADYEPQVVMNQPDQFVPVEVGNGWYLRGDVGYAVTRSMGDVDYRTFDIVGGTYTSGGLDRAELDSGMTYGIGFGYTFNPWLRADITLDGFNTDLNGRVASTDPCDGAPAGTTCNTTGAGSVTTLSLMANGYVDLGTYVGFTPYVGAGAGMSRVKWGNFSENTYCVDGAGTCAAPALLGTTRHSGKTDYRFTYALMAGLAYDISQNLKLDIGYKYTHVGGGDTFNWDTASAAAGATGTQGHDDGFSSQEVRVGLRYELW
jgi:opacity protein-like surface antigen